MKKKDFGVINGGMRVRRGRVKAVCLIAGGDLLSRVAHRVRQTRFSPQHLSATLMTEIHSATTGLLLAC